MVYFIKALNYTSGSLTKIVNLKDKVIVVGFGAIMEPQSLKGEQQF